MDRPRLPPLIMGGAGFSYQLHPSPETLPVLDIIKSAFARGLRTIDTSPYYEPSEELLGAALSRPDISSRYRREDFQIMTKCGRIAADHFDYSPAWIRKSVERSLQRFGTTYLDVVFCHDVEFVTVAEAVAAVGTLLALKSAGQVKHVGISGYDLDALIDVARAVLAAHSQPVDVVQSWAQLSLQNTRLEHYGLPALRTAGVQAVCNASPLACGLLRSGGVPVGQLGDWHPAPPGLREASQRASAWVDAEGETLASVALQFAVVKSLQRAAPGFSISTITGISTLSDLDQNVATASKMLEGSSGIQNGHDATVKQSLLGRTVLRETAAAAAVPLFEGVQRILGDWIDYDFSGPSQSAPAKKEKKQKERKVVATVVSLEP